MLSINVDFDENMFLSTYDVYLYVDNVRVGRYPHGVDFVAKANVSSGTHIVRFQSVKNSSYDGTITVPVSGNTLVSCNIHCHSGYIKISGTTITPDEIVQTPAATPELVAPVASSVIPTEETVTTPGEKVLTSEVVYLDLQSASDEDLDTAIALLQAERRSRMVTKINLNHSILTLSKGKTEKLTAEVVDLPDGVKATKFVWDTSDKSIATCTNGTVKAVGDGKATISCSMTLSDGTVLETECMVEVVIPVTGVVVTEKKLDLGVGQTAQLTVSVKPDNATDKSLTFKSSDLSVATVDATGNVCGVGIGKATVTVTANDGSGKSVTCPVTVSMKDDVGVTKIDTHGVSVTMKSVRSTTGSGYFKAEAGNVIVLPMFEIANNGKREVAVSTLLDFDAFCDGYSVDYSFSASCNEKGDLGGSLPAGKKMKGEYAIEVPSDWKEIEVRIKISLFDDPMIFMIYRNK